MSGLLISRKIYISKIRGFLGISEEGAINRGLGRIIYSIYEKIITQKGTPQRAKGIVEIEITLIL